MIFIGTPPRQVRRRHDRKVPGAGNRTHVRLYWEHVRGRRRLRGPGPAPRRAPDQAPGRDLLPARRRRRARDRRQGRRPPDRRPRRAARPRPDRRRRRARRARGAAPAAGLARGRRPRGLGRRRLADPRPAAVSVLALVDCNNFFVSCERVFRPGLERRPVVVLSSNDGCVISRSEEAKALGIGMGVPFFEVRALCVENRVEAISANHELYADLSRRVAAVLRRHAPDVEGYSIDESFLTFPPDGDPLARARALRAEVARWTGVPVSVGLGPSKALAKLASDKAKKAGGVLSLLEAGARERVLAATPVEQVWGIARRSAERLAAHGARTAADFAALDDALLRKTLGVGGLRLAQELRGLSVLAHSSVAPPRQSVTVSRSFGRAVGALGSLESAAAAFAARAAERARRHGLRAGALSVFVGWREDGRVLSDALSERLPPTDRTPDLVRAAKALIGRLFVEGRSYRKAGVVLGALEAAETPQAELFDDGAERRARRLEKTVDGLNAALGPGTLSFGGDRLARAWAPRSERRSPCWTTRWEDLPRVR
ncbi:MAG: Y-family DNA polymerase [Elusimicrobia bacterium]|nr:Y-family DNA polymerase [Elusimicrobiota bacterium]